MSLKSSLDLGPYKYRSGSDNKGYIVYPYFNFETRWYSNLDRKAEKGKKTEGNTGNIWSISTTYSPDYILLTNQDNPVKSSLLSIGPNYTIRRTFGKHFNIEGNVSASYGYIFKSTKDYLPSNGSYFYFGAGIRLGYHFIKK